MNAEKGTDVSAGSWWSRTWDRSVELPLWARVLGLIISVAVIALVVIGAPILILERAGNLLGEMIGG